MQFPSPPELSPENRARWAAEKARTGGPAADELTVRDAIALAVLPSLWSAHLGDTRGSRCTHEGRMRFIPAEAYEIADAVLKARAL